MHKFTIRNNQTPSQYTRGLYETFVSYVISNTLHPVMGYHREKQLYTTLGITAGLTHVLTMGYSVYSNWFSIWKKFYVRNIS